MIALSDCQYLTPEQYLQLEAESPTKHEYIDGEVFAMAGTTDTHNTISLNLAVLLRNHLRGTSCSVYFADIKARLDEKNCFYYPDLLVTCETQDRETPTYKRFPKLIVEVLSDSTEAFDRGDKFNDYQTLASLEEYILVNTKHQRLEIFRRTKGNIWTFQSYGADAQNIAIQSIDLTVAIADIYEDVEIIESK
ncbi:MAG: Uma2 family endonuclease [Limnothrix sp. RL_2_0]|nr:Uma2 family endonuclease [Limnothrix sp. RL_2_0]